MNRDGPASATVLSDLPEPVERIMPPEFAEELAGLRA